MLTKKDWEDIKRQSVDIIARLRRDSEISILASELMLKNAEKELKKCQTDNISKEEEKSMQ